MGKQAPQPADYTGAAQASSQSTRPNVTNAFGSTQWTMGPNGQASVNQQLSPEVQRMFQSLGAAPTGDAARQQAFTGLMDQAQSRLNPMFATQSAALDQRLANQGLAPTSAAARAAQRDMRLGQSDMMNAALAEALRQSTGAGESAWRMNMAARNQPIADMQAMQGFLPGLNYGQGANFLGAATAQDQAALQKWLSENQANADLWQGLLQAGMGAAMFASDKRLKTNITHTGHDVLPGVPMVDFEYIASPGVRQRGVLAQDVQKVAPGLVAEMPSGYLAVDYAGLWRAAHANSTR